MLPWCLNTWPCREGAHGAWDNAVTACSSFSVLYSQSQLGWDGLKVLALSKLGLLPAAPLLACGVPCVAAGCPAGLHPCPVPTCALGDPFSLLPSSSTPTFIRGPGETYEER